MAPPTEAELKRRLRVVAAWSDASQPALAEAIGVKYPSFKNYFSASKPGPPLDVVMALADHVGVPRDFVLYGWGVVRHDAQLERRLAAIEERVGLTAGAEPGDG